MSKTGIPEDNSRKLGSAQAEAWADRFFEKKLKVTKIKRESGLDQVQDASMTYKVTNAHYTFLVLFAMTVLFAVIGSTFYVYLDTPTRALLYIWVSVSAPTSIVLAMYAVRSVRREGDNLILVIGFGKITTIPITNIKSVHLGYKPVGCCAECLCCTHSIARKFGGEAFKPYCKTVVITLNAESTTGCGKPVGFVLTLTDCDAFLNEITEGGESSFEVVVA